MSLLKLLGHEKLVLMQTHARRQRCNDSAFLDSRLNLDSDKVFGFNSNSIFQDAHCL